MPPELLSEMGLGVSKKWQVACRCSDRFYRFHLRRRPQCWHFSAPNIKHRHNKS